MSSVSGLGCHPERSEGSRAKVYEILPFAQDDRGKPIRLFWSHELIEQSHNFITMLSQHTF
jgi:hypothetical protein